MSYKMPKRQIAKWIQTIETAFAESKPGDFQLEIVSKATPESPAISGHDISYLLRNLPREAVAAAKLAYGFTVYENSVVAHFCSEADREKATQAIAAAKVELAGKSFRPRS